MHCITSTMPCAVLIIILSTASKCLCMLRPVVSCRQMVVRFVFLGQQEVPESILRFSSKGDVNPGMCLVGSFGTRLSCPSSLNFVLQTISSVHEYLSQWAQYIPGYLTQSAWAQESQDSTSNLVNAVPAPTRKLIGSIHSDDPA